MRHPPAAPAVPLLLLLVGCVAVATPAAEPSGAGVILVADDLFYEPATLELLAGGSVTLHLRNDGSLVHDLVLDDGSESGVVHPGDTVVMELGPLSASTVAWCSVPGHRDAGMELELVVREGATS